MIDGVSELLRCPAPGGDGTLAYRDTGAGRRPPVVLLHGGFLDHTFWNDQVPALAAAGHRVVAPDARGHGWSDNATRPFRFTDDLAALLRHLDAGPAVLVGLSMGAMVAVDTALEHPELVRALVICGGGTAVSEYRDPWAQRLQNSMAESFAAGDIFGWIDACAYWAAGPARELDEVDPEILRRVREMQWHTFAKHTPDEADVHVHVPDTLARAQREIDVPVLALNGALDVPDLIGVAERIASAAPGGRALRIDGTAHFPNLERPEEFNRAVLDFLATVAV
jgi:pimeloyl-ACP methyl ester carboxylesterase